MIKSIVKSFVITLLAAVAIIASPQSQINPVTQIKWANLSTSGIPSASLGCGNTITGTPTSGSPTVSVTSVTGVILNQTITGTDIPANTTVTGINAGASTITLSANASGSPGSETLTLYALGMPATDSTNHNTYACGNAGWFQTNGGGGGSGTVSTGTPPQLAVYTASTTVGGDSQFTDGSTGLTYSNTNNLSGNMGFTLSVPTGVPPSNIGNMTFTLNGPTTSEPSWSHIGNYTVQINNDWPDGNAGNFQVNFATAANGQFNISGNACFELANDSGLTGLPTITCDYRIGANTYGYNIGNTFLVEANAKNLSVFPPPNFPTPGEEDDFLFSSHPPSGNGQHGSNFDVYLEGGSNFNSGNFNIEVANAKCCTPNTNDNAANIKFTSNVTTTGSDTTGEGNFIVNLSNTGSAADGAFSVTATGPVSFSGNNAKLTTAGALSVASCTGCVGTVGAFDPSQLPAVVQSTSGACAAVSFVSNVKVGDLVLAYVNDYFNGNDTVTDTLNTNFSLLISYYDGNTISRVFGGLATTSGADTVTANQSASWCSLSITEASGVTTNIDATATATSGTSPTNISVTTTVANDFIIATAGYHGATTYTYGSPFTLDSQYSGTVSVATGHDVATSTGAVSLAITSSAGAGATLVALKPLSSQGNSNELFVDTATSPNTSYVFYLGGWHLIASGDNISAAQTSVTGTTAGTAVWSQPAAGSALKVAVLYLNGYENTTATAQTITLPASYATVGNVVTDGGSCTGVTVSGATITLPASMSATQTGLCEVRGY